MTSAIAMAIHIAPPRPMMLNPTITASAIG
jgi:hypothetical protein